MRIDVRQLEPSGDRFEGRLPVGALELAEDDPLFSEIEGVAFDIRAQPLPDTLLVRGGLRVVLRVCCVRCRETYDLTVRDDDFFADFSLAEGIDEVDLTPAMREAILLALPSHPVCQEACRGLCPHCGADRNRATCDCAPPADVRWSALDELNNENL